MTSETQITAQTKREKRLAAREDRKHRATLARRRAKIRRTVLMVIGALLLAGVVVVAINTSLFGLAAPQIGRAMPVEKAEHVPDGTVISYRTRPPTSGAHYDAPSPSYGMAEQEVPPGNWVHNLEHGAIVLLYNCPSGCPDLVAQIKDLYASLPRGRNGRLGGRLLAVKYADMDHKLAVAAWGRLLELDDFDPDQIRKFYDAYIDRGPECQNLVCPP